MNLRYNKYLNINFLNKNRLQKIVGGQSGHMVQRAVFCLYLVKHCSRLNFLNSFSGSIF